MSWLVALWRDRAVPKSPPSQWAPQIQSQEILSDMVSFCFIYFSISPKQLGLGWFLKPSIFYSFWRDKHEESVVWVSWHSLLSHLSGSNSWALWVFLKCAAHQELWVCFHLGPMWSLPDTAWSRSHTHLNFSVRLIWSLDLPLVPKSGLAALWNSSAWGTLSWEASPELLFLVSLLEGFVDTQTL